MCKYKTKHSIYSLSFQRRISFYFITHDFTTNFWNWLSNYCLLAKTIVNSQNCCCTQLSQSMMAPIVEWFSELSKFLPTIIWFLVEEHWRRLKMWRGCFLYVGSIFVVEFSRVFWRSGDRPQIRQNTQIQNPIQ